MQTSPFLDEIRAEGREQGREQARQECRAEGQRAMPIIVGRQKFAKTPTKKQQKTLEGISDPGRLEALGERLFAVDSWADLLTQVDVR